MEQAIIMFASGVMAMVYHENLKIIKFRVVTLSLLLLRANQRQTHISVICMTCGAAETRAISIDY